MRTYLRPGLRDDNNRVDYHTSCCVFSKRESISSRSQSTIGLHLFTHGIDGSHVAKKLPSMRILEKTIIMITPKVLREVWLGSLNLILPQRTNSWDLTGSLVHALTARLSSRFRGRSMVLKTPGEISNQQVFLQKVESRHEVCRVSHYRGLKGFDNKRDISGVRTKLEPSERYYKPMFQFFYLRQKRISEKTCEKRGNES